MDGDQPPPQRPFSVHVHIEVSSHISAFLLSLFTCQPAQNIWPPNSQVSPEHSMSSVPPRRPCDIYAKELLHRNLGYPLFHADPARIGDICLLRDGALLPVINCAATSHTDDQTRSRLGLQLLDFSRYSHNRSQGVWGRDVTSTHVLPVTGNAAPGSEGIAST